MTNNKKYEDIKQRFYDAAMKSAENLGWELEEFKKFSWFSKREE